MWRNDNDPVHSLLDSDAEKEGLTMQGALYIKRPKTKPHKSKGHGKYEYQYQKQSIIFARPRDSFYNILASLDPLK